MKKNVVYKFVDGEFRTSITMKNGQQIPVSMTKEAIISYLREYGKPAMIAENDHILISNYLKLFTLNYNKANPPEPKEKGPKGGFREGSGRKPKGGVGTRQMGLKLRTDLYQYIQEYCPHDTLTSFIEKAILEKIERECGQYALARITDELMKKGDGK